MLILTVDADLRCAHEAALEMVASQKFVTVEGRQVLVENDPEGRTIHRCPNTGLGIKPCLTSLKVKEGYSDLVRIDGHRVCLEAVRGLTDGTPPGFVEYRVRKAGQEFVRETA